MPQPLFILSAHHAFGGFLAALLGGHPAICAAPGLNLLASPTVRDFIERSRSGEAGLKDGLLRFIAQVLAGEQTVDSVEMARRWLLYRAGETTTSVVEELARRVAPRLLVERSILYTDDPATLPRIAADFPESKFIHLTRHPVTQGLDVLGSPEGAVRMLRATTRPGASTGLSNDPQVDWFESGATVFEFFQSLPNERHRTIRAETLAENSESELQSLCAWVNLPFGSQIYARMCDVASWPFAGPGPFNAVGGTDGERIVGVFGQRAHLPSLDAALPWHQKKTGLAEPVKTLAREFGYAAD